MYPLFFKLEAFSLFGYDFGPFEVHTYGIMVAAGFAFSTFIFVRLCLQDRINPDNSLDMAFWFLLSGLLGSRLMFMIVNVKEYFNACYHPELPNVLNNNLPLSKPHCWEWAVFWEGGLVWYGGLLGGLLAGYILLKRFKLSFPMVADAALMALSFGHFLGRLGCHAAGCCWGRITDSQIGVIFPPGSMPYRAKIAAEAAQYSVPLPLIPTQLLEASGELIIFFILLLVRYRRRFHGQVALVFLMLYPILRSILEVFRGDKSRGYLIEWQSTSTFGNLTFNETYGISVAQVTSLVIVVCAIIWMRILLKKTRQKNSTI